MPANDNADIVISDVNIVDVTDGEIKPTQTVYIRGNQITKISPADSLRAPDGATVIDGRNKYLIPGLWDMHTHIVSWDWVPNLLLANGVTGIRVMHGTPDRLKEIKSQPESFYKRLEVEYSSPIVDGEKLWEGSIMAQTPEDGRRIVRQQAEAGYDLIKVYHSLDRNTFLAIAEEAKKQKLPFAGHVPIKVKVEEAIAAGQRSLEHSSGLIEYVMSNRDHFYDVMRGDTVDTALVDKTGAFNWFKWNRFLVDHYQPTRLEELSKLLGRNELWITPTLVNHKALAFANDKNFKEDPRRKYLPTEELEAWESVEEFPEEFSRLTNKHYEMLKELYKIHMKIVGSLAEEEAQLLAGTDISMKYLYPGFSLHDELALFVEAGLTPAQALRTATLNAAAYLDRTDELGTVEAGKLANLVLLNKNPLEDIRNIQQIEAVITRGNLLDKKKLDEMLTLVSSNE